MAKVGRPPKLTPEQREEVYNALVDYIARTPDPTIVGFVAWDPVPQKYDVLRANINDWPEFSTLVNKAIEKQEAFLLEGAIRNKLNPTMAIFRLKQPQHGYTDKVEQDHNVRMVTPLMQLEQGDSRKQINAILEEDDEPVSALQETNS